MPNSIRPGDVLADRYLLVDLLSESGSGRFWRAHDRTLDRHVSVHVLAADDDRAEGLMEAARRSAALHDRRILRVLDVDRSDDVCYVVNEWGSGRSIDVLVAHEGAVGGRRAAWIVSEVAESIAAAHDAGVAHGRLVPENVMIDQTGSVRIIGLAVEAALLGLPTGRMSTDVTDLAGLLYYLLTAKWPGVSRSGVPAAPLENGRVLRPRQVKAGVQRPLDSLCDQVLNAPGAAGDAHRPGLRSAHGITEALRDFVGDVAAMAEAEASAGLHPGAPLPGRLVPPPANATTRFPAAGRDNPTPAPGPTATPPPAQPQSSLRSSPRVRRATLLPNPRTCPRRPAYRSSTTRRTRCPGWRRARRSRRLRHRSRSHRSGPSSHQSRPPAAPPAHRVRVGRPRSRRSSGRGRPAPAAA